MTNLTTLLAVSGGGTAGTATFGAPIELDLGGRGIREIRKNASNQYAIVAGPAGDNPGTAPADFRLYTWTGNAVDVPVLRSTDLTALNAGGSFESIVEVPTSLSDTVTLRKPQSSTTNRVRHCPMSVAGSKSVASTSSTTSTETVRAVVSRLRGVQIHQLNSIVSGRRLSQPSKI